MILIWGRQPVYSGPPLGTAEALVEARLRGARIYAIKPSIEADGSFATDWIPVRPGTDAALALAMLHVVTGEGLIDKNFVDQWVLRLRQACRTRASVQSGVGRRHLRRTGCDH